MGYWDFNEPDKKISKRIEELHSLIDNLDCDKKVIMEIGIYKGTSTRAFSEKFDEVYSVDIRQDVFDYASQFNLDNVTFIMRDENDGKLDKNFKDGYLDVLYIDGNHHYEPVLEDLKQFAPLVKKGGYITGHDYGANNTGVKEAVIEFFGKEPDELTYSHTSNGKNFIYKV